MKTDINTIFTDDFPFIETNKELEELFKKYPDYDKWYIASGSIKERKEIFDKLWERFKPYADKHFLKEVKLNFHQRTWEMYIANVLIENGLDFYSKDEGPDFIIKKGKEEIYLECIAIEKGDPNKPFSVSEFIHGQMQPIPEDKIKLRIIQGITDKIKKYKKWTTKNWFNSRNPFIISINTGKIKFPQIIPWGKNNFPFVLSVLAGVGPPQVKIPVGINPTEAKLTPYFAYQPTIKKGEIEIESTLFLNKSNNIVSAVIYSNTSVLNHPDKIGDDCHLIFNPLALNPIKKMMFPYLKKWGIKVNKGKVTVFPFPPDNF